MRPALAFALLSCACVGDDGVPGLLVDAAPQTEALLGAWSHGEQVLVAGGSFGATGRITRITGDTVCAETDTIERTLWWIHGRGAEDWYAVGERGAVLRQTADGRVREDIDTPATLFGVFDDGEQVWAVGGDVLDTQRGGIWRKAGGADAFEPFLEDVDGAVFKVHDGWFVGDGVAWYWDGATLHERHPPDEARLLTVRSLGPDRAFAVGGLSQPVLLEWADGAWLRHEVPPRCAGGGGLNGVFTVDGDDVHIAGNQGAAATRHADGSWTCPEAPVGFDAYHAVWGTPDALYWVGGNLFSSAPHHGSIARAPAPRAPVPVSSCD